MSGKSDPTESQVRQILVALGEDPDREGLRKTPARVMSAFRYFTKGYAEDPRAVIGDAMFTEDYSEMIIVKDIDFFSLCEHHLLPFFGRVHVAYIPKGRIVGISKVARLVETYARRLQVQERMTDQIANTLSDVLGAGGVGVVVEAEHMCMRMRGVEKPNSVVVTSSLVGVFRERETRQEFNNLISTKMR